MVVGSDPWLVDKIKCEIFMYRYNNVSICDKIWRKLSWFRLGSSLNTNPKTHVTKNLQWRRFCLHKI